MAKWISDAHLDLILEEIAGSDREVMCSAQPLTFFNAVWPDLWVQDTVYVVGDLVHPPTENGYIYECIVGGTSGSTEPGWETVQDNTFIDNEVTWKTHENFSLASTEITNGSITISDGDIDGRKATIPQITGVITHYAGTVSHAALLDTTTKTLNYVTEAATTIAGDNNVEKGRTTIFFTFDITIRDPS